MPKPESLLDGATSCSTRVTVKEDCRRERSLVSTSPLPPGSVALTSGPIAAVSDATTTCDACADPVDPSTALCASCRQVSYCAKSTCQTLLRDNHAPAECSILTSIYNNGRHVPTPTMRLLLQVLLNTASLPNVLELTSHWESLANELKIQYAQAAAVVVKHASGFLPSNVDEKQASFVLARIACNAHAVTDTELRPRGKALYLPLALVNHSCRPSCCVAFNGFTAVLRTIDVVNQNEELTVGYCDLLAPSFKRRSELRSAYMFDCCCERCTLADSGSREEKLLSALRCQQGNCKGALIDDGSSERAVCTSCTCDHNMSDLRQLAQSTEANAGRSASELERNEVESAVQSAEEAVQLAKQSACKGSAPFTKANDALMRACIESGRFDRALSACRASLAGYEIADDRKCLPLLGLQYAARGKLERYCERLVDAYKSLRQAVIILEKAFGDDSPIVREVKNVQLMQTEAELKQYQEQRA